MNKEIEKYVWYYLAVYIVVLFIFALFQYFTVCEGASLNCKTNWEKVKDILQTTAYILTPIIAIIGFISWKVEYNTQLEKEDLNTIKSTTRSLKEIFLYFDSHFRDLYLDLEGNDKISLKDILINHRENVKELYEKRNQLTHITMKYYSALEDSIEYKIEDKKIDEIYRKINEYKWHIDLLVQSFDEDNMKSFIHYFELFNFRSTNLIDEMKNQIKNINIKLKI